jgi:hypothetical protein
MLSFNLSQSDRVSIHTRICFSTITAKELAQMSSTDLANEETKQSIKLAEKEALEHSILQKATAPRAKITHKGLQDIEDVNWESAGLLREREKEREKEEEERRERERLARLQAAEQHQKERAGSIPGSTPPESPIAPQSATWGGPPPFPMHHMHADSYSPIGDEINRAPLFTASASDFQTFPEPELDIADLINLDDDPPLQDTSGDRPSTPPLESSTLSSTSVLPPLPEPTSLPPLTIPPTSSEPSPVLNASPTQTVKPETPSRISFDLNALWSSPKGEFAQQEIAEEAAPEQEHKDYPIEVDTVAQEATDQDFDMFLEKDQDMEIAPDSRPQDPEVAFQAIPPVWNGMVNSVASEY